VIHKAMIAALLLVFAYCSPIRAEVLIDESFESASAGSDIAALGWTNTLGSMLVSEDIVDTGHSAKNNVGGWSDYIRDFSTRKLTANETAIMSWVGRVGSASTSDAATVEILSPDQQWNYCLFNGTFASQVYKPGAGIISRNDFASTLKQAKFKTELTNKGSKFYYDTGAGWVLALSNSIGSLTAGKVNMAALGAGWIDTMKYEIIPTPQENLCPNVYVHLLRYSSSLLFSAISPWDVSPAVPPKTFTLTIKDTDDRIVLSKTIPGIKALSGAVIPVSFPTGKYRLSVTAQFKSGTSKTVLDREWQYTKTPEKPVVSVRKDGVYLANGKPVFPLGLYHVKKEDLNEIASAGLNMAMSQQGTPLPPSWTRPSTDERPWVQEQNIGYAEECARNGIQCIGMGAYYLEPGNADGQAILEHYRNNSSIGFWYVMDEPDRSIFDKCQRWYEQGVNWDPTHPFFILQVVPSKVYRDHERPDMINYYATTAQAGDIFAVDPYPLGNLPLRHVYDGVDTAVKSVFGKKPVWAVLQSYTFKYKKDGRYDPPMPTTAQLKCMSYQALAAGARGILYYAYDDSYLNNEDFVSFNLKKDFPDFWKNSFITCISELKANSKIWTSGYAVETPVNETPAVVVQKKPYILNKKVYMLVVNPEDTEQSVRVRLPELWSKAGKAEDILGSTPASLLSGLLKDTLAPLQAKCYRIGE